MQDRTEANLLSLLVSTNYDQLALLVIHETGEGINTGNLNDLHDDELNMLVASLSTAIASWN